jgi:hypothetical protein
MIEMVSGTVFDPVMPLSVPAAVPALVAVTVLTPWSVLALARCRVVSRRRT